MYPLPRARTDSYLSTATVVAAHVLLLGAVLSVVPTEKLTEFSKPMQVRMVDLTQPISARHDPPPPPKDRPRPVKALTPPPVLAVAVPATESPASFTVAPQVAAPAAPVTAAPVEAPITAARFDADYLHNPKPVYPAASRRLGEQGKVVLRVHVGADGSAEKVELKSSSGFARLDTSAQDAVSRWRFVPARRGDQAVAAWVLVPIAFNLDS
jgi:protein TonB